MLHMEISKLSLELERKSYVLDQGESEIAVDIDFKKKVDELNMVVLRYYAQFLEEKDRKLLKTD